MHRTPPYRPGRLSAAGLLVLAALFPLRLAGQEPVPISRADLTRMLAGETYTPDEVARMVRRVCIDFRLADGDLGRFRELGATDEVVEALVACREAGNAAAAPLRFTLPDTVIVRVADTAAVRGRVTRRGGTGVPGVPVVLEAVAPGDAGRRLAAATSGPGGEIVFRLPAGKRPGRFVFGLRAASVSFADTARVVLVVRPGPLADVEVRPRELTIPSGRRDSVTVRVRLTDAYGNAVPGVRVLLAARSPAGGPSLARGETGPRGAVPLSVPGRRLEGVDRVGVWARDSVLTWIPVRGGASRARGGPGPAASALIPS